MEVPNQQGVSLFRNRAYDANSGRWLQEDPIGIAGGVNLYQFNGNNPVAYTDPFGLCPLEKDGVPCTLTMGGTALMAGAGSGALMGGAGGTFVVPGVGTVAGAGGGAIVAGTAGLIAGGAVGAARDVVSIAGAVVHEARDLKAKVKAAIVAGLIWLGGGKTGDVEPPPPPAVEQEEKRKPPKKKEGNGE